MARPTQQGLSALVALTSLFAACSGPSEPATVDVPQEIRDQLHAATGHTIEDCVDLRGGTALIEINDGGFLPECSIVSRDQSVELTNRQDLDDTWIVADPENNLVPRHIRLLREVAAGEQVRVERIGEFAPTGVWPCYGRESRHQCRLVVVP
ncbi:MAG: hypothetical protein ACT4OP_02310 [Actinomycetota bacterium]